MYSSQKSMLFSDSCANTALFVLGVRLPAALLCLYPQIREAIRQLWLLCNITFSLRC